MLGTLLPETLSVILKAAFVVGV